MHVSLEPPDNVEMAKLNLSEVPQKEYSLNR